MQKRGKLWEKTLAIILAVVCCLSIINLTPFAKTAKAAGNVVYVYVTDDATYNGIWYWGGASGEATERGIGGLTDGWYDWYTDGYFNLEANGLSGLNNSGTQQTNGADQYFGFSSARGWSPSLGSKQAVYEWLGISGGGSGGDTPVTGNAAVTAQGTPTTTSEGFTNWRNVQSVYPEDDDFYYANAIIYDYFNETQVAAAQAGYDKWDVSKTAFDAASFAAEYGYGDKNHNGAWKTQFQTFNASLVRDYKFNLETTTAGVQWAELPYIFHPLYVGSFDGTNWWGNYYYPPMEFFYSRAYVKGYYTGVEYKYASETSDDALWEWRLNHGLDGKTTEHAQRIHISVQNIANSKLGPNGELLSNNDGTRGVNGTNNLVVIPEFDQNYLETTKVGAVYGSFENPLGFPFRKDPSRDGYYVYNSTMVDGASDNVILTKDPVTGEYALSYNRSGNTADQTLDVYSAPGYFPFSNFGQSADDDTPDVYTYENIGQGTNANAVNFGFGTRMDIPFIIPSDADEDVVFHFSGDDDLWVFVDGELALDLGGVHKMSTGNINFTTGVATADLAIEGAGYGNDNIGSKTKTLSESQTTVGTKHLMTIYYMERGLCESNLWMEFNFVPITAGENQETQPETQEPDNQVNIYGTPGTGFSYVESGVVIDAMEDQNNGKNTLITVPAVMYNYLPGGGDGWWNQFTNFNRDIITYYTGDGKMRHPLLAGTFNNREGGGFYGSYAYEGSLFDYIRDSLGGTANVNYGYDNKQWYYNHNPADNGIDYSWNGALVGAPIQGMVGEYLSTEGELLSSENNVIMPFFDDDFLTGRAQKFGSMSDPISFPFRDVGNGYYIFDSRSGQDNVYMGSDGKLVYSSSSDARIMNLTDNDAGFFPFNTRGAATIYAKSIGDRANANNELTTNYAFGTRMDIPFKMPASGSPSTGDYPLSSVNGASVNSNGDLDWMIFNINQTLQPGDYKIVFTRNGGDFAFTRYRAGDGTDYYFADNKDTSVGGYQSFGDIDSRREALINLSGSIILPLHVDSPTNQIKVYGKTWGSPAFDVAVYDNNATINPLGGSDGIIFRFSGDDDLWVYVDGRLALDMGGTHGRATGEINFTTGDVTISSSYYFVGDTLTAAAGNVHKDWLALTENSKHTLTVFYMERGLYDSNLKIEFNFVPINPSESDVVIEEPTVITIEAEDYLIDAPVVIKTIAFLDTPVVAAFDKGEELEFAFDVPAEGYYNTSIFTSKKYAGNSVFNLMENGEVIAKFTTTSTGSLNTFAETAGPRIYLTAGEHNVTLAAMHSNTYVDKFVFTPFVPCEPSAHVAGEWTVVTEPTTSREGLRTSVCTVCGEEITEIMPRIYQSVSVIEAEDYTNDAEVTLKNIAGADTPVVTAYDKNESLEFTFTIEKDDYYDTGIFTSRKYAGNAVFTLSENGTVIAKFTTAPTGDLKAFAETAGPRIYLTAGEHMVELVSNNGNTYVDKLVFTPFVPCEPSAHVAGEWTVVTEPTTSREGLRTSVCTVCGEEITEIMPRIYQSVSVIEAEDYTNDAEVTLKNIAGADTPVVTAFDKNESLEFTFTIDKDDYYDTSIFTSRKYAGNAVFTLSENGTVIAKFTTAPTGDLKVFAETAGPRIYLTAGEHRVELVSNNGNTYVDKLVFTPFVPCEPSAHVAGEWTVTLEPTTSREGVKTSVCTVCGAELTESIPRIYQSISVVEAEDYTNDADVALKSIAGIDTPVIKGFDKGESLVYTFTIESDGYYDASIFTSRKYAGNALFDLIEDGETIAEFTTVSTGDLNIFAENKGTRIYLTAGEHTVELVANTGSCYVDKLVFTPFVPCDPSAHVAGEWVVTLEPTTSREGVQTTYCTICGEEMTESLPRIFQSVSVIEAEDYVNDADVTIKNISGIDTPVVASIANKDEMEYIFTVEKSGYYNINTIGSRKSTGTSRLILKESGVELADLEIASTGAFNTFADNAGPRIYLRRGTHTVTVYAKAGSCYLDKIVFTPES